MKTISKLIAILLATATLTAQSEISRTIDSFDGRIFVTSKIRSNDDIEHNYTGDALVSSTFTSYSIRGDFNELEFYKVRTAQQATYYMLRVHGNSSEYYSSVNSTATLNVDGTFINLVNRWDTSSIRRYYIEMDNVIPYLTDGNPHSISLRLSTGGRTYTVKIDDRIKKEWLQVIEANFDDGNLGHVRPIGGSNYIVGKTATGWVADPHSRDTKPMIHVYRGSSPLFAIQASSDRCREMGIKAGTYDYVTTKQYACDLLGPEIIGKWRKWVYNFDLESINGASTDPIRIIAINSKPGKPATELHSQKMILKDDIECVYNWAEKALSSIIPEKKTTINEGVYKVRRYSNGLMFATVFGSGDFSFQLPGGQLTASDNLGTFLPTALAAGC